MAEKAPMIGVIVSPSLLQRLKAWQVRERRQSFSEFCSLLLEFSVTQLDERKSLQALFDMSPVNARQIAETQAQKARTIHGKHAKPHSKYKRSDPKAS